MGKLLSFLSSIVRRVSSLPLGRWVEIVATIIGLIVDSITLVSYIGFIYTPTESPSFYENSQEFLVWSLIALIYSLGLVNALILRRWRSLFKKKSTSLRFRFVIWKYDDVIFGRAYAWSVITTFPFTYLYTRAISVALSGGNFSAWGSFFLSVVLVWIVALMMLGVTHLFDAAFSLYSGEGDIKSELTEGLL